MLVTTKKETSGDQKNESMGDSLDNGRLKNFNDYEI